MKTFKQLTEAHFGSPKKPSDVRELIDLLEDTVEELKKLQKVPTKDWDLDEVNAIWFTFKEDLEKLYK